MSLLPPSAKDLKTPKIGQFFHQQCSPKRGALVTLGDGRSGWGAGGGETQSIEPYCEDA